MENYFYRCDICGFVHLVPAYWMSFTPELEYEMPHVDSSTGQMCENIVLKLVQE